MRETDTVKPGRAISNRLLESTKTWLRDAGLNGLVQMMTGRSSGRDANLDGGIEMSWRSVLATKESRRPLHTGALQRQVLAGGNTRAL